MTSIKPILDATFFKEPAGNFVLGHIVSSGLLEIDFEPYARESEVGYWHCDLTDHDALTWSEKVYEIFDFPKGTAVAREDAVAIYKEHSRGVLERLRTFAIKKGRGFILDAAINPHGGTRWIRILAAPVMEEGRVVGLRGLKRILTPELR